MSLFLTTAAIISFDLWLGSPSRIKNNAIMLYHEDILLVFKKSGAWRNSMRHLAGENIDQWCRFQTLAPKPWCLGVFPSLRCSNLCCSTRWSLTKRLRDE